MAAPCVHVVGAGLSGLGAAVRLVDAGRTVVLWEAAGHAGGRCRTFFDPTLNRWIDNGNHLVLSGNWAVAAYLGRIGARDGLIGPDHAAFDFRDLQTGETWTVRPGRGVIPWWLLDRGRRVPGAGLGEYLRGLRLAFAKPQDTVEALVGGSGALYKRFWEPLSVAVLNAHPSEAAAALLRPVLKETFGRGAAACRPLMARDGLGPCFIEPAVRFLEASGGRIRLNRRVRTLVTAGARVEALDLAGGETVALGRDDAVVLAVPPAAAAALVPGLQTPEGSRAIVNGHFRLPRAMDRPRIIGLVGGLCQWVFVREDVASTTVSAADAESDSEALARRMWPEVRAALGLGDPPLPAWRVVKEKRATFAQTVANLQRRPAATTQWRNLALAGDWTATGLPATIEGSLRSGARAADVIVSGS